MSRIKVQLTVAGLPKSVSFETDATIGATFGTNFYLPDGKVATVATFRALLGLDGTTGSGGSSVKAHRLLTGLNLGDDHPQYVRKDTLTTQGDLYTRGAVTVERLPLGPVDQILRSTGTEVDWYDADANPSVSVGLTIKNGTANTFMRSDAAPALDQAIAPTWTGVHRFNAEVDIHGPLKLNGAEGTTSKFARSNGPGAAPSWEEVPSPARGATFVSPSGPIVTPVNDVYIRITKSGTINKVTLLTEGGPGACIVDVWKDTYANFPPTVADSICGAAKPTISGGIKYEDATLTGWTTTVTAGDVIVFHLQSVSTFSLIFIQLDIS